MADDAKADLEEAMPALNSAMDSLKALNKNDITEIKSFAKPPPLVQMTMEAVCILKGEKPDWDSAKKVLNDSGFMKSLEEFDKDNIPDAVRGVWEVWRVWELIFKVSGRGCKNEGNVSSAVRGMCGASWGKGEESFRPQGQGQHR